MIDDLIYFKPKSKEKILKALENDTLEQKFNKAIENNISWLVEMCIEEGIDPSKNNNWALRTSISNGSLETVKIILKDERVDPSLYYNFCFQKAVNAGHIEIVKFLLEDKRVDPSDDNNIALQLAQGKEMRELLMKDPRVIEKSKR
jgi:hypothetical protein